GGEERAILAAPVDRDLPLAARATQLHCPVFRLELQCPASRCRFRLSAPGRGDTSGVEAGRGGRAGGKKEGSQVMKHWPIVSLAVLLAISTAPDAFGWGVYHGAYGGAAYRGPMGGAAVRGPYGGAAARGPYGGAAYRPPGGGGAYYGGYHGGTYYHG